MYILQVLILTFNNAGDFVYLYQRLFNLCPALLHNIIVRNPNIPYIGKHTALLDK